MRVLLIAIMAAASVAAAPFGSARAQDLSLTTTIAKPKTEDEFKREQALESGYRSTLQKIPNQQTQDPWGNVRTPGASEAQAKPAKKAKKID